MHRFRAWGLTAALASAVGVAAASAADPAPKPWYSRVFAGGSASPAKPADAQPISPPVAPLTPEALADALKAEQDAYLRRLDVCTRLREVANRTNDDRLSDQADALEQQATALYHQRTARLGVRGPRGSTTTTATAVLDRTLGTGAATDPLAASRPPADTARPATAQVTTRFKEVQP
ncbi:MAG: hypothetical protein ACRC7O_04875 [Fimbriiglobus sp.]